MSAASGPPPKPGASWPQASLAAVWPQSAQTAIAFFLGVALALLSVWAYGLLRLGARPSELQAGAFEPSRVDLNRATPIELRQLPGIGKRTAEQIDIVRREAGPFRAVEDLANVPGIGPATVDKVRQFTCVQPPSGSPNAPLPATESPSIAATAVPKPPNDSIASRQGPPPGDEPALNEGKDRDDSEPAGDAVDSTPPRAAQPLSVQANDDKDFVQAATSHQRIKLSAFQRNKSPKVSKEDLLIRPINVNQATEQQLQRLPGVGPVMARRIAVERAKGLFQSIQDLRRVSGIGPTVLERLRPHVTVEVGNGKRVGAARGR